MPSEGFKFACPYCSQHIRAYDEHIGDVVYCPTCEAEIVVPNPYATQRATYVVDEPPSPFYSQAELMAIRDEPDELKDQILEINKEGGWELAILGLVLKHKLAPLHEVLEQYTKPHSFHDEPMPKHETLFSDIDDRFNRFITVMYATYDILLYGLPRATTQESLVLIMDFGNKVGAQVDSLIAYHRSLFDYALPMQEPYPTIQDSQLHWARHVYNVLASMADSLSALSRLPRGEADLVHVQTSLCPPNLRHFLVLRQMLVRMLRQDREEAATAKDVATAKDAARTPPPTPEPDPTLPATESDS